MGLAKDRLNGLLASPSATSAAHIRALALLAWIVTDNATWVMLHFAAFPASDITYRLLWLFDAVVISVEALQTATIYGTLLSEIISNFLLAVRAIRLSCNLCLAPSLGEHHVMCLSCEVSAGQCSLYSHTCSFWFVLFAYEVY